MSRRESTCWLAALVAVGFILCWPFLTGQSRLGFRDTAHFYYPLFQWLDAERAAGHTSQWIPFDACGMPLVADAGTCPAYPLQLIFRIPGVSFPARFGWYVTLHLVLALLGAYVAARRLSLSPASSAFAAFSYGLGGATLSQTCNLVYLIGAAWLPWWLAGVFSLLQVTADRRSANRQRRRELAAVIGISLPLSLMILGGDPQSAYLGLLILAGLVAVALLRPRPSTPSPSIPSPSIPSPSTPSPSTPSPSFGEGRPHDAAGEGPGVAQPAPGNPPPPPPLRPHRAGDSPPKTGESEICSQPAEHHRESTLSTSATIPHREIRPHNELRRRFRLAFPVLLAGAAAAGLSAAAWLPQVAWNQRSVRTYTISPRSVWEWAAGVGSSADVRTTSTVPGGEIASTYEFSLPPWALAEFFAPTIAGKLFPIHRRWDAGFPAADRVWYPSLYPGVLVTLLLLGASASLSPLTSPLPRAEVESSASPSLLTSPLPRVEAEFSATLPPLTSPLPRCGGEGRVRGLSAILIQTRPEFILLWTMLALGILGAFGWYGLGWLWREISAAAGWPARPGFPPQAGGVYWWMQWLLPGFCQFRYPAKLFVLASLAVPLLAASALDRLSQRQSSRTQASLALVHVGLCGLGFAAVWVYGGQLQRVPIPADGSFGPFDAAGAVRDLQRSLLHAAAVSGMLALFVWPSRLAAGLGAWRVRGVACLALADLLIANTWLLPRVPADLEARVALPAAVAAQSTDDLQPTAPGRETPRGDLLDRSVDPDWIRRSSPARLEEILEFQAATDFPKFHLLPGRRIFPAFNSIEPQDLVWLENWLDSHPQQASEFWRLVGVGCWTGPFLQLIPPHMSQLDAGDANVDSRSDETRLRTRTRLRPDDQFPFEEMLERDLAWLGQPPPSARATLIADPKSAHSPDRVHVRMTCTEPCCLVVGNYWDPGWNAALRDCESGQELDLKVHRFAGVLQCIPIARAGDYELEIRYAPPAVAWGHLISSVTAGLCLVAIAWRWRRTRRSTRPSHTPP